MKNNYVYKILIVILLGIFLVPNNTYATTYKTVVNDGIAKDTVGLDYRLSAEEEGDILEEIEYYDRKGIGAIILYVTSLITLGITGIIASISSFKTFYALRDLEERLKNYPEDAILKKKLNGAIVLNTISLGIGALFVSSFLALILFFAASLSGAMLNSGLFFLSFFAASALLILEVSVFKTNRF